MPARRGESSADRRGDSAGAASGRTLPAPVRRHGRLPYRQRSVPFDPRGADAPLRVRAAPPRRAASRHRHFRSDEPADDRRAEPAARHAAQGHGRRALGHPVDAEEERKLAARAGRSDRKLSAAAAERRRERRGLAHRRAADQRHQSDHPPRRLDDLHRAAAARQRHPHRDARRCGLREVPDRRRAADWRCGRSRSSSTARSSRASR